MSEPTRETTCQHVFGKSTETSWRWCGLCGLPEAVLLLATAEAEAARWKANDAASTEVIATTTIAWNAAEARATAAEQVRDLRITDHALLVDSYRELETDLLIVREKLAAAEQREAEKDQRVHELEASISIQALCATCGHRAGYHDTDCDTHCCVVDDCECVRFVPPDRHGPGEDF